MSSPNGEDPAEPRGEHFLPVSLPDLVNDLVEPGGDMRVLCKLYQRLARARMRQEFEELAEAYAPMRPDEDVLDLGPDDPEARQAGREDFLEQLDGVLLRANYRRLGVEDIEAELKKTSPNGLSISVNLEDYEVLRLYTRGCGEHESKWRAWKSAFTRHETSTVPTHRRLFLAISVDPNELHLKLFRDVPETDLEMLLPNTRVRIRVFDKIKMGVTGGGGVLGGAFSTITKLSAAVHPVTACIAIAGLGGVLWRQVANVLAHRTKYMAALNSKLYFHNLDNNQGALAHLVELAGNEECKEALLAYVFLRQEPCDHATLDARIEKHLHERYGLDVDYEVSDGVRKLHDQGLLLESPGGELSVLDESLALERLTHAWIELGVPSLERSTV